jgi:2-iminobutanoate/2-iminopropanoate deaminase
MKRIMSSPGLPEAQGPYCMATVANGFVFVSGQGPWDDDAGEFRGDLSVAEQTRLVLECIKTILEQAGTTMDNVVQARVFLKDKADFVEMNGAYAEYFSDSKPARTTVEASPPIDIKVEIDVTAVLPS